MARGIRPRRSLDRGSGARAMAAVPVCARTEGRAGPSRVDLRPSLPLPTVPRDGFLGGRGAGRGDSGGTGTEKRT